MILSIASLIRKLIATIPTTQVGEQFIQIAKDLQAEIPEMSRGVIKPEMKSEACDKIYNAYLAFIQKVKGHGLSEDKAGNMVETIKTMKDKNDFKGLVGYPYQFALAWKAPANMKEADAMGQELDSYQRRLDQEKTGEACKDCGKKNCVCEASSKKAQAKSYCRGCGKPTKSLDDEFCCQSCESRFLSLHGESI